MLQVFRQYKQWIEGSGYRMCVIAVSCKDLELGRMLAKQVADELGCHFIDEDTLARRTAENGHPLTDLRRTIRYLTGFDNEFTKRDRVCLSLLREAFFHEIQSSRAVCYGPVTSWLPLSDGDFLRIEIRVSLESLPAIARKELERTQALSDEFGESLPFQFTTVAETCRSVVSAARDYLRECPGDCEIGLRQLALGAQVEAALILDPYTSRADLRVTAKHGWISLSGAVESDSMLHHVRRVAERIPGVMHVDSDTIVIRPPHPTKRLVLATVVAIGSSLLVANGIWQHLRKTHAASTQTFVGVITDTRCAEEHRGHHMTSNSECVRACVRSGDKIKYALDDGKNLYVLSDAALAERYAGLRVRITGLLDAAKSLRMHTISGM